MRNHTHQGLGLPPINIGVPEIPKADDFNPFSNLLPSLSLTTIALGWSSCLSLIGEKRNNGFSSYRSCIVRSSNLQNFL